MFEFDIVEQVLYFMKHMQQNATQIFEYFSHYSTVNTDMHAVSHYSADALLSRL
jgi:hypothetical protein